MTSHQVTILQVSPQMGVECYIFLAEMVKRKHAVMEDWLDLEPEHKVLGTCLPF